MINLQGIDSRISEITREVDFYLYLTPLNQEEEREKFFSNLGKGTVYDPVFRYKDVRYFYQEKWLRETRAALDENDDMHRLFIEKMDFIATQLKLIKSGDAQFTDIAARLYGIPDAGCLDTAKKILTESKDRGYVFPEETVTPDEMASILREKLKEKGIGWEVVLSRKIVPNITVSPKDRTIYVNSGINYTAEEIERLKVHEIEVHIYRGVNGENQPYRIFAEGLAGYDETEEGLAIVAEEITGCLKSDTRQMKLYAGRAICVDYCMKGTFYETFMNLREFFPDDIAYRLTERGKRGLRDTSKKGGFTKGFHYISGWRKVKKYVEEGGDLSILYMGKIGLEDVESLRHLLERGELKPPKYLPGFVKT